MNRDDAPARMEAPPRIWEDGGDRFAAPVDLEAGGTWIGVNPAGVTACLLNRYDDAAKGTRSRGELVPSALKGSAIEAAAAVLEGLTHRFYSPFTCLLVSTEGVVRLDWNGVRCERRAMPVPDAWMITSSSWRFEAVAARRQALFQDIASGGEADPEALSAFHCAIRPGEEAWAPMMARDYAHTKSVTQIVISTAAIELRYWTRDEAIRHGLARQSHVIAV